VRQKERLKIEAWQTPARAILDTKISTANRSGLIDMPTGRSLDDIKSTVIGLKPKISRTGQCCPHGWIAMGRSRSWEINILGNQGLGKSSNAPEPVWRFRSLHHDRREFVMRTSEPEPHSINSFASVLSIPKVLNVAPGK
jgi:hypothetical protein